MTLRTCSNTKLILLNETMHFLFYFFEKKRGKAIKIFFFIISVVLVLIGIIFPTAIQ